MPELEISNAESDFYEELLDAYQHFIDLPLCIVFNNGLKIYSSKNNNTICHFICSRYPKLCENERNHNNINMVNLCKSGLLCYEIPIEVNKCEVGVIKIGHVIINGYESKSESILVKSLHDEGANKIEVDFFRDLMKKAEKINLDKVSNGDINKTLLFIKYILEINLNQREQDKKKLTDVKILVENLAHQYLTPIQGIVGNAENLINEYERLPRLCQDLEIKLIANDIYLEIQKLALCADNIRNWIASEHNLLYRYDFHMTPIFPIIIDTIKLFRAEAKSRDIIIKEPEFSDGAPPNLKISGEHMRRVFYNVISNAVKYSFEGTPANCRWIEIKCNKINNYYCIDIINYGVGILPEEIDEKIYQPGYRGKLAMDRNRYGSGLGLGVIRKIVEDHGGGVKIISEAQGDRIHYAKTPFKTIVRICLPLSNEVDSLGRN